MTREEGIKILESLKTVLPAAKDEISEIIKLIEPTWISVKDDLPCNHEELMSAKYETKEVLVLKNSFDNPDIDFMLKESGKWIWFDYNSVKFWLPIPEPPKE